MGVGMESRPKAVGKKGWEQADFPVVCETCLGPNPYVRMTKAAFHSECKVCARPFTVFRWRPGGTSRFKKTEICQTCAKLKNVCQVCILDLDYGVPTQVRDTAFGAKKTEDFAESEVMVEYNAQQNAKKIALGLDDSSSSSSRELPSIALRRLRRDAPYYKRNQAHICSFFVRGTCNRGEECPYRHEMPSVDPNLASQNIKSRYYGKDDPVAEKLLNKAKEMKVIAPPANPDVKTLYIGGLTTEMTEDDIRDHFYGYGELKSIKLLPRNNCAFVTYLDRKSAEQAINTLSGALRIKGTRLKLAWGKPQKINKPKYGLAPSTMPAAAVAGAPPGLAGPPGFSLLPPPGISKKPMMAPGKPLYPSMDPTRLGAKAATSKKSAS